MLKIKRDFLLILTISLSLFFQSFSHADIFKYKKNNFKSCSMHKALESQNSSGEVVVALAKLDKTKIPLHSKSNDSSHCKHNCIGCLSIVKDLNYQILISNKCIYIDNSAQSFIKSFSNQLFRPPITA